MFDTINIILAIGIGTIITVIVRCAIEMYYTNKFFDLLTKLLTTNIELSNEYFMLVIRIEDIDSIKPWKSLPMLTLYKKLLREVK